MATSIKLVILLCGAATAVFAQDLLQLDQKDFNVVEIRPLTDIITTKAASKDQSAIFGSIGLYDRLLHYELVDVKKAFLQIQKKDVTYPQDSSQNGPIITCIKINDALKTGQNADFKIGSGGVGQKFVIINMRSKRGNPIKYYVEIYGR